MKISVSTPTSDVDYHPSFNRSAIEGKNVGREETREKICRALEKAGVEFIDENGVGPGVRLRKAKRRGK